MRQGFGTEARSFRDGDETEAVMKVDGDNSKWPGPAAAGARRVAEDNEAMLKRWKPAAAGQVKSRITPRKNIKQTAAKNTGPAHVTQEKNLSETLHTRR